MSQSHDPQEQGVHPDRPRVVGALPVAFDAEGALDLTAVEELLHLVAPHVDQALVAGTTGEFPALTEDERVAVFATAATVLGPDRVIAHVGAAHLAETARLITRARELGIEQLAVLTPYYLPADEDMLRRWFEQVLTVPGADRVYGYLFPERTGLWPTGRWVEWLLSHPGTCGLKLSGRSNELFDHAVAHRRTGQAVYTGDDATLPQTVTRGGAGVVSGVSSVFPERFAALRTALVDEADHASRQDSVLRAVSAVGPSIAHLKRGLALRTGRAWCSRMLVPELGQAEHSLIAAEVARDRTDPAAWA